MGEGGSRGGRREVWGKEGGVVEGGRCSGEGGHNFPLPQGQNEKSRNPSLVLNFCFSNKISMAIIW